MQREGSGIPFVWGHALLSSMQAEDGAALWGWAEVAEVADVIRYDTRGHGLSSGGTDPEDYRWPNLAADMLALGDHAVAGSESQRCVFGGMSMGAATALQAALLQPEKAAGMVLVIPPTAWDTRPRQAAIYRRMSRFAGLLGSAPFRLLNLLPTPVREDGRSRLGVHVARGLARAKPRQLQAALRGAALSDLPSPESLAALRVPALILAWEDDPAHPVSTAEQLADLLPNTQQLLVTAPDKLSDWLPAILGFLENIDRAERRRAKGARKKRH